jgi:hypothetical protein
MLDLAIVCGAGDHDWVLMSWRHASRAVRLGSRPQEVRGRNLNLEWRSRQGIFSVLDHSLTNRQFVSLRAFALSGRFTASGSGKREL